MFSDSLPERECYLINNFQVNECILSFCHTCAVDGGVVSKSLGDKGAQRNGKQSWRAKVAVGLCFWCCLKEFSLWWDRDNLEVDEGRKTRVVAVICW